MVFVVASTFTLLRAAVNYFTTELAVTESRVVTKRGFVSRTTIEQQLNRIDSISVSQGILGRALDYGKIEILGSGATMTAVNWIMAPLKLRHSIEYAINAAANNYTESRVR